MRRLFVFVTIKGGLNVKIACACYDNGRKEKANYSSFVSESLRRLQFIEINTNFHLFTYNIIYM